MKKLAKKVLGAYALGFLLGGGGFAFRVARSQCVLEAQVAHAAMPTAWHAVRQDLPCRCLVGEGDLDRRPDIVRRYRAIDPVDLASERWGAYSLVATIALGLLGAIFSLHSMSRE